MILDLLDSKLDGVLWEDLMTKCYKMVYKANHYTTVPAKHKGDCGIEGFTNNGIVTQCYYPQDENMSDNDLFEHLRDKMTADINKLIDRKNALELQGLGIKKICEWHFLIVKYPDKRIIQHAAKKVKEVLLAKSSDPEFYDYICEKFSIYIKVPDDFFIELSQIIRSDLKQYRINLKLKIKSKIDWSQEDNEKIENVQNKIIAINPELINDPESLNELLDMYMKFYIEGIEMLELIGEHFPDIRKDLTDLISSFRKQVRKKTLMNTDFTINHIIFEELGNKFQQSLEKDFSYLNSSTISDLRESIIAFWLADCSLKFRRK